MATSPPSVRSPDELYAQQRYIKPHLVDWVEKCDAIMLEHGFVVGAEAYPTKDRARYPGRKLKDLMVRLGIHEGWQLKVHVDRTDGGWMWSLEYVRRPNA